MLALFFRYRLLLTALLWLSALPSAWGIIVFNDVAIDVMAVQNEDSYHGYVEYLFSVQNTSTQETHEVVLTIPAEQSRSGNYEHIRQVKRAVRVGPSSRLTVSLFQPPLPVNGSDVVVAVDGQEKVLPMTVVRHMTASYRGSERMCILASRNLAHELETVAQEEVPATSSYNDRKIIFADSANDVRNWSSNWLGYSRYDGVVVTGNDMALMPFPVQLAIKRYVECGGSLLVLGAWQPDAEWRAGQRDFNGLACYYPGFGICLVSGENRARNPQNAAPQYLSAEQWQAMRQIWHQTFDKLQQIKNTNDANNHFPVVENLRLPVRGLFLLVLLFALLIGPVNISILTAKKKRIWLLWTVPAVSIITCVTVFIYAMVAEGWHGYARTQTLTILDENSRRATTIGWVACYSPLTPRDGLHFSYDTEVTPQVEVYSWNRQGQGRMVDWTNEQQLGSGWVLSRVPSHFTVRKSQAGLDALLRLTVEQTGSRLKVGNSLGVEIDTVWVADRQGNIYFGNNIAPGQQAELKPLGLVAIGTREKLRQAFGEDWLQHLPQFTGKPETVLRPGCYLARVKAPLFIEEGLLKVQKHKADTLVYGIMKGSRNED